MLASAFEPLAGPKKRVLASPLQAIQSAISLANCHPKLTTCSFL
jgi:hypothetical protein